MKNIAVSIFFILSIVPAWADEGQGVKNQTDVSLAITTEVAAMATVEHSFVFPYLQGTGPLTEDNNITVKLTSQVSPATFQFMTDAIWTPLAILNLSLGAEIDFGWNYTIFGSFVNGLGLYQRRYNETPEERAQGAGLDGIIWRVNSGATLQFDFAAVFPGDWNHVVISLANMVKYQNYTKAKGSERWYFLNDDDLYQNSFNYYFSGLLGYQMPIFLSLLAFMFETTLPFYNPQSGETLSGIEPEMLVSLAADFKISKKFNIMGVLQFQNLLQHPVTPDYERLWQFYRVVLISTWHVL